MVDIPVYSSMANNSGAHILHVITHKSDINQLCGNIENDFPNAYTNYKVFVQRPGP